MLQLKAFILTLCFLIYFFDTIAAVNAMQPVNKSSSCCAKMKGVHATPISCPKKTTKNCVNDCINCPLFYTTTLSPFLFISIETFSVKKRYPSFSHYQVSDYFSKAWKPPNHV